MPLLPLLQALGNSIGLRAFQSFDSDAHLQWFLVQVLERAPRPHPHAGPGPGPEP